MNQNELLTIEMYFCISVKYVKPMKVLYSYITVFILHVFFLILYIYVLLNDAVSSSDYI
jgi:hypothetical protein